MRENLLPIIKEESGDNTCINHCNAACCHDVQLHLHRAESDRFIDLEDRENLTFEPNRRIIKWRGERLRFIIVYIRGKCPFLSNDNSCSIYDDRPHTCKSLQPKSEGCTIARARYNKPPLA